MIVQLAPKPREKLKKQSILIRKAFKIRILIFSKDPFNPQLRNHLLRDDWEGCRSIDINADWRAVYKELQEHGVQIAYFVAVGTHKQLYKITRKSR